MLEFFEQYGPLIAGYIISAGALAVAVYSIITSFGLGKKVNKKTISLEQQIQITRQGIIEAFKSAKLPNEIRLSISTKVEEILTLATDKIIETIKKNEATRTAANLMILKILNYTAASSKLTDEERQQIEDILKVLTEEDNTVNI